MLSEKNRAILLMAQTKSSKDKPKSTGDKEIGNSYQKRKPVDPLEGNAEWVRFKSECVLLKGKGK